MLHYSEVADERKQVKSALDMAEKILSHINESIRELEGRERLRTISLRRPYSVCLGLYFWS